MFEQSIFCQTGSQRKAYLLALTLGLNGVLACGGGPAQRADISFVPSVENPAFPAGEGPVVAIDEAHHNFHRVEGRYKGFADLLRQDGYVVKASSVSFSADALADLDILVISNALAEVNVETWSLPTPSAFSDEEVEAVNQWVEEGGSLLLIADHMPFPGAVENLAGAFGVRFSNGFARDGDDLGNSIDEIREHPGNLTFRRSEGSLADHPITSGVRANDGQVDSVTSFTGSAFKVDEDQDSQPLLLFSPFAKSMEPETAWEFELGTTISEIGGWLQGAALEVGEGRAVILGEAAMLTAQVDSSGGSFGMTSPGAEQNPQFLLNLIHWLSFLGSGPTQ